MFKKILIGVAALALSLTLATGTFAATAKSKRSSTKKTAKKKTTKKARKSMASDKQVAKGSNVSAGTGLLFSDTAQTPDEGKVALAAHLLYQPGEFADMLMIPFGAAMAVAKDLEVDANLSFNSMSPEVGDSASGLGNIEFGGKYVIRGKNQPLDFGVGLKVSIGPLSDELGESTTNITPHGIVTYTLPSGVLINGQLGFMITGKYTYTSPAMTIGPITIPASETEVNPDDVIMLSGGVGVPFTPKITGIAELGINQFGKSASALSAGIRTTGKTKFQVLIGLGLGDFAPDFTIGAGVLI